MSKLQIWFLDVGHGDCAYLQLPNGARMMIDCGGGEKNWPSKMLKHYRITKDKDPIEIPTKPYLHYGIDNLVISHLHADHISDIEGIHDDIGFFMLTGQYRELIKKIPATEIDFRGKRDCATKKVIDVINRYNSPIDSCDDRIELAKPTCIVKKRRFINDYSSGTDINDMSWFVSLEIGGQKVLFTGDMTATGVKKILESPLAEEFKKFVKGTTILKVPHHGRENGCSQEMFDAFGCKPLVCVVSDEILNEKNEGTSATSWYSARISDEAINVNGEGANRKVLTTRDDGDIYLEITDEGVLNVTTNVFAKDREKILGGQNVGV